MGRSLAGSTKHLRKVMMNMLAGCGEVISIIPSPDGPQVRAVRFDVVETEFRKSFPVPGDTDKQKRDASLAAFKRALKDAGEKDLIATREIEPGAFIRLQPIEP